MEVLRYLGFSNFVNVLLLSGFPSYKKTLQSNFLFCCFVIIHQELEDTIESLRQQISVLQSRARVLQEELDTRNQFSSSFNVSAVRDRDEL